MPWLGTMGVPSCQHPYDKSAASLIRTFADYLVQRELDLKAVVMKRMASHW